MGVQLIFTVETNKKCNSDWIYIKDTVEYFYAYERTQLKLSVVYLDGKGHYSSKKKQNEIDSLISQYRAASKTNQSKVICCFDCDDYDSKQEDRKFLEDAEKFCKDKGYEFVWFCKDVEQVYIGKRVAAMQKKKEAAKFAEKKQINTVDPENLTAVKYRVNRSNIMKVLDGCPELIRKKS